MNVKKGFLTLVSFTILLLYFTLFGILVPFLASLPRESGGFKTLTSKNDVYKMVDNLLDPDEFYNFRNNGHNINILANFYNTLNSSNNFDVLTSFNQAITVTNFKGDHSFYYNSDEFIERSPSSAINIKALQLNQKAFNFYNIKVTEKNQISWKNVTYKDNYIPILLGADYKKYYQLGDTISGNYYSKDVIFKVIGFLEKNCFIKYKGISDISLDTYLIIPYPTTLWNVDETNFQFESLLYFAMINCDILPFVNESQILKDIKSISNKTGFSDFSLVGIDNFQIYHIELLLFIQKHLIFFTIGIISVFVLSNIICLKSFHSILQSIYKVSITQKYYIKFFVLNIIIPYGIAFLLGTSISVIFLNKILPLSIIAGILCLLITYSISYIWGLKCINRLQRTINNN